MHIETSEEVRVEGAAGGAVEGTHERHAGVHSHLPLCELYAKVSTVQPGQQFREHVHTCVAGGLPSPTVGQWMANVLLALGLSAVYDAALA